MGKSFLYFLSPIFIGIGATMIFDLWGLFLKYVFKISPSNFCLVARWIRYMLEGIFKHSNIASVPQKRAECPVDWITHYAIGIAFAIAFVAVVGTGCVQRPHLHPRSSLE